MGNHFLDADLCLAKSGETLSIGQDLSEKLWETFPIIQEVVIFLDAYL